MLNWLEMMMNVDVKRVFTALCVCVVSYLNTDYSQPLKNDFYFVVVVEKDEVTYTIKWCVYVITLTRKGEITPEHSKF